MERFKVRHVSRDAAVPCAAVILIAGGHDVRERSLAGKGEHALRHGEAPIKLALPLEAVMADKGTHAPRGHLHAVEGQRHGQADEVHRVVGVMLRHVRIVVVLGAQPEQARGHVFGKLVGDVDARAVGVEDRGTDAGKVRQRIFLEAHAHLGVGLRDGPVNVAVANLDLLAVRAEGCAIGRLAPVLVADFKVHHALEGFRSDHVDLGTDTAGRPHLVVAVTFREVAVGERHTVLHQAGYFEVDRLCGGGCAEDQAGGEDQGNDALHTFLPSS